MTAHVSEDRFAEMNRNYFDQQAESYRETNLFYPEIRLLQMLRGSWHKVDLLDIGIGAGRTTHVWANIVNSYTGIDYVEKMIGLARLTTQEGPGVRLAVMDARTLASFADNSFDVVIFSFNGLDNLENDDRYQCLREINRVLREDGLVFLSSHCLHMLSPAHTHVEREPRKNRILRWRNGKGRPQSRSWWHARLREFRAKNEDVDLDARLEKGWAFLRDSGTWQYYVTPQCQVQQLEKTGFLLWGAFDLMGMSLDACDIDVLTYSPERHWWIHYLAGKKPLSESANVNLRSLSDHVGRAALDPASRRCRVV